MPYSRFLVVSLLSLKWVRLHHLQQICIEKWSVLDKRPQCEEKLLYIEY